MMTKAGTNAARGTVNHQYWTNKFNPPNRFQQVVFDRDPRAGTAYEEGLSHNLSMTFGGPVLVPGIINGRNKLFTFVELLHGTGMISTASRPTPTGRFHEVIPATTTWPATFRTSSCCRIPRNTRSTTR